MAVDKSLKKKDFERIFKKGKKIKENFLMLVADENKKSKHCFGFVVSRKISKKATVRNKIKRRLRSLIKAKMETIKKGLDVIVVAFPGAGEKSFRETEETIDALVQKTKRLLS